MHCSRVIKLFSRSLTKKSTKKLCNSSSVYFVRKNASGRPLYCFLQVEYRQNKAGWQPRSPRIDAKKYEQDEETERLSFSSEMEVAKLSALPNLEVRLVSCNESAIKRWLSSELEETVFSLTHELFMTKHHTVTLRWGRALKRKKKKRQTSQHHNYFLHRFLDSISGISSTQVLVP